MRITPDQCDEIIDAVERIRDDLAEVHALDENLRRAARPDGYRSSVRPMEGTRPATDDRGNTLPNYSDPTGSTVLALMEDRTESTRGEVAVMTQALREMLKLARQADGARARVLEPVKEHAPPEGCKTHAGSGMGWEPIHAVGRCRWCYDFWAAEGVDPPASLLRARHEGRRISQAMVAAALSHPQSKRARKRRRKAG